MAAKVDFYSLLKEANSGWQKYDAGEAKRQKIAQRQKFIADLNKATAEADAAVRRNASQSTFSKVKQYAPSVIGNTAKSVGSAVVDLPKEVGKKAKSQFDYLFLGKNAPKNPLTAREIIDLQNKAKSLPDDIKHKDIGPGSSLEVFRLIKAGKTNAEIRAYVDKAAKAKAANDKKMFGAILETASYAVGGGSLIKSFTKGGIKAAAGNVVSTGVSGATGNVGNTLRTNPEASGKELFKSGVQGAEFGVGGGIATAAVGQVFTKAKLNRQRAAVQAILDEPQAVSAPITDTTRLLPAMTSSKTDELTTRLDDINARIEAVKTGSSPNTTYKPSLPTKGKLGTDRLSTDAPQTKAGATDMRTNAGKRQGTVAPARSETQSITGRELRALNREKAAITAELKNIERVAPVSQLDDVNRRIAKAQASPSTTPQEAYALKQEKDIIRENIAATSSPEIKQYTAAMDTVSNQAQISNRYTGSGEHFAPHSAEGLEARAVANKLAGPDGLDIQDTATRMSLADEGNRAVDMAKNDYTRAKRIALGMDPPPIDLQDTSIMLAVEERATREADTDLIQALAQSPIHLSVTKGGQRAAALANVNPESPVDLIKLINRVRGKSPNNLASKFVTADEAKQVTSMAADVAQKREAAVAQLTAGKLDETTRLAYGDARVRLDNYVDALKAPAVKRSAKQVVKDRGVAGAVGRGIVNFGGITKSLRATLDNSAIGRQGIKVLFTHPKTWAKNSLLTFRDFAKTIGNKEMHDVLKADIISRPNSLNGLYKQIGADVINITEEAYPSGVPERMWGLGRFVKASDAAYTGFVQRSRADLADQYIKIAKKAGVNLSDKAQAQPIGHLVNALTGRGKGWGSEKLNNVFFSPKLLKSNIDVLGGQLITGAGGSNFVRKQAAINLVKIVASTAAVLKLADAAWPGSVERDPRSSNFGKIKIGNTRFDVTGGMSSLATLAARTIPTTHGGKLGVYSKSSISGDMKNLSSGDFGADTLLDVIENFGENKLAPATAYLKDLAQGTNFNGENTRTPGYAGKSLFVPLSVANYTELRKDPNSANKLVATIADALGVSTNTYGKKQTDWRNAKTKELTQFRESVSEQQLLEANDKYNKQYIEWLDKVEKNDRYNKLDSKDRTTVRNTKQNAIRTSIFKEYGFKYKQEDNKDLKGF